MTLILELPQFSENQCMTEMKIRTGGIDAQFNAQRPAESEFFTELGLADDLGAALLEKGKCLVRLHKIICRTGRYLFLFSNSRTCSIVSGRS